MSNETTFPIVGNLTGDPELRYTPAGVPVANFTIASTPRHFDKQRGEMVDGDTVFLRCAIWRDAAEHVADSLVKGNRVLAIVELKQRTWEKDDGSKQMFTEGLVLEIGPSLQWHTAKPVKAVTGTPRPKATPPAGAPAGGTDNDPWASAPPSDEPPF